MNPATTIIICIAIALYVLICIVIGYTLVTIKNIKVHLLEVIEHCKNISETNRKVVETNREIVELDSKLIHNSLNMLTMLKTELNN